MNIKEFNVTEKPFKTTLMFELYEGSDFDKKAHRILKKDKNLFAEGKFDNEVFYYNITNKMSLRKYMALGMNQKKMFYLIERLIDAELCFIESGVDPQYMMYDADLVLVDKDTEEITFIYVPATDHGLMYRPLKPFIKEILANAVYDEMENLDYVGRLITYINKNKVLDIDALPGVLADIKDSQKNLSRMTEHGAVAMAKAAAAEAVVMTPAQENILEVPVPEKEIMLEDEPARAKLPETNVDDLSISGIDTLEAHEDKAEEVLPDISFEITEPKAEMPKEKAEEIEESLVQAEDKEAVMSETPVEQKKYPYLVRAKNQEIITIDKDEFKLGKIFGADYMLSDNPAVSRMHAIIHNVDNTYYICDNYSTNATYLNDERLEPGKNYLLMNGVKVRLANDEFTYICEA